MVKRKKITTEEVENIKKNEDKEASGTLSESVEAGDAEPAQDTLTVIADGGAVEIPAAPDSISVATPRDERHGRVNKFDLFFIKVWAFIVAAVTKISESINFVIHAIFKKYAPLKYIKAAVSVILVILGIVIVAAPFNITVNEQKPTEIYSNGLIPVKMRVGTAENNEPLYKWGYADKNGNVKIECAYDDALPFAFGVAFVRVSDYYILINKSGKIVNEKKGARKFYVVSNMEHKLPVGNFDDTNRLAWVSIAGKYGFINTSGNVKIEASYDGVSDFTEGLARVKKGNSEYFIDKRGKKVGASFEKVRSFQEGLAAVKSNSGWGFINKKGKMAIEYKFDAVSDFKGGYALVLMGAAYGVIDQNGKYVVSPTEGFEDIVPKDISDFDVTTLL